MSNDDTERKLPTVHVVNAAQDTVRLLGEEFSVIRGRLRPQYFEAMEVPEYQRRLIKSEKHDGLIKALDPKDGVGIPDDLLLCTRTARFRPVGTGEYVLAANTALYVLDGHQRYGAAMERLGRGQHVADFGVKIILGTTPEQEVDLFYQVNRLQTKVSSHVHLRNAGDNATFAALRQMAEETDGFPTIQWDSDRVGEITAHMLYEVAVLLHGYGQGMDVEDLRIALEEISDRIGTDQLTENVKLFFEVLHRFEAEKTQFAEYALRAGWLKGMAMLFGRFDNFWSGERLRVRQTDFKTISGIKFTPFTQALTRSNPASALYTTLRDYIDRGRDANRLVPRQRRGKADE